MHRVFNDTALEASFRKNGYLVLPLFNAEEIEVLSKKSAQLRPSDNFKGNQETALGKQSFHVTFFDKDTAYKKSVFDFIRSTFSSAAATFLSGYKCAQANIFLKPPGVGFVYPHQNLTIANEEIFTTVSFWLPLQDTDFGNGALCVVPGSQNGFVKYRNTHVYWPYVRFFKEVKGLNYFKTIEVKAGELLILDDRIIHYTPINTSSLPRWVLHSLWAPLEARLQFCDPATDVVRIYDVEDDFWQYHMPGTLIEDRQPDRLMSGGEVILTEDELIEKLERLKNSLAEQS